MTDRLKQMNSNEMDFKCTLGGLNEKLLKTKKCKFYDRQEDCLLDLT